MKKLYVFIAVVLISCCTLNMYALTCPDKQASKTADYYLTNPYYAICTNLTATGNPDYPYKNADNENLKIADNDWIDYHWDGDCGVIYDDIYVSKSGNYNVTWSYRSGSAGSVKVTVNGVEKGTYNTESTNWQNRTLVITDVALVAGQANTIKIWKHTEWPQNYSIQLSKTEIISFDSRGGSNSPGSITKNYLTGNYGTLPSPGAKTGYTFDGWYTAASGGDKISNDAIVTIFGDHTLYAHWTANTYTITYELNGGTNYSGAPTNYTIETNTITLGTPTKRGFNFACWFTDSGFTQSISQIAKGSTGNKTLYAKWDAVTDYYLSHMYWAKDAQQHNTHEWASHDTVYREYGLPEGDNGTTSYINYNNIYVSRTGYYNIIWYAEQYGHKTNVTWPDGSTEIVSSQECKYLSKKVYLQANTPYNVKFQRHSDLTGVYPIHLGITLIWDGENLPDKSNEADYYITNKYYAVKTTLTPAVDNAFEPCHTNKNGKKIKIRPSSLNKENILDYHYAETNADSKVIYDNIYMAHAGDYTMTCEMRYGKVDIYVNNIKKATVEPGETGTLTQIVTLTTGPNTIEIIKGADDRWTQNRSIQFSKTESISFDSKGGSSMPGAITKKYLTDNYGTLPSPGTKTGYTFEGWYTEENGGGIKIENNATVTTFGNHTLYAKWTPNEYTITFVNYDGTQLQSSDVEYGTTPTYSGITPTKPATADYTYTHNGWTPAITSVTGAQTYMATFEQSARPNVVLDQEATTASWTPGEQRNVQLTRTLLTDEYNTLCLPFDVAADELSTLGEGVQLYTLSSVDQSSGVTLNFTLASSIEAGTPYLVAVTSANANPMFTSRTLASTTPGSTIQGNATFHGVYVQTLLDPAVSPTQYFLSNNLLYRPVAADYMKGLRGYFTVKAPAGTPIRVAVNQPSTPTELDQFTDSPLNRFTKIIKDNQLIIIHDGKTYNAQGIRQ